LPDMTQNKETISVLFVCTGNSCRSQMAEGFIRAWAGDRVNAMSAGSYPAAGVSPLAVEVMKEIGIDISGRNPKSLSSVQDRDFDWVITLCDSAKQACPIFHSRSGAAKHLHWSITDPYEASEDAEELKELYREVRDEIGERIRRWLREELGP